MEMTSSPRTVEEIFKDFSARRAAVVRALTYGNLIFSSFCFSFPFLSFPLNLESFYKYDRGFFLRFLLLFSDVDGFYGLCDPGNV
jgi:hypothetical protein